MKKILYSILKKNKTMYDFIFEQIIKDRELETIERVIGNKQVIYQNVIKDKNIDITNSIFFNVMIQDCMVHNMTENIMKNCHISNIYFGKDMEIKV